VATLSADQRRYVRAQRLKFIPLVQQRQPLRFGRTLQSAPGPKPSSRARGPAGYRHEDRQIQIAARTPCAADGLAVNTLRMGGPILFPPNCSRVWKPAGAPAQPPHGQVDSGPADPGSSTSYSCCGLPASTLQECRLKSGRCSPPQILSLRHAAKSPRTVGTAAVAFQGGRSHRSALRRGSLNKFYQRTLRSTAGGASPGVVPPEGLTYVSRSTVDI
jgi:hypothetical protein